MVLQGDMQPTLWNRLSTCDTCFALDIKRQHRCTPRTCTRPPHRPRSCRWAPCQTAPCRCLYACSNVQGPNQRPPPQCSPSRSTGLELHGWCLAITCLSCASQGTRSQHDTRLPFPSAGPLGNSTSRTSFCNTPGRCTLWLGHSLDLCQTMRFCNRKYHWHSSKPSTCWRSPSAHDHGTHPWYPWCSLGMCGGLDARMRPLFLHGLRCATPGWCEPSLLSAAWRARTAQQQQNPRSQYGWLSSRQRSKGSDRKQSACELP